MAGTGAQELQQVVQVAAVELGQVVGRQELVVAAFDIAEQVLVQLGPELDAGIPAAALAADNAELVQALDSAVADIVELVVAAVEGRPWSAVAMWRVAVAVDTVVQLQAAAVLELAVDIPAGSAPELQVLAPHTAAVSGLCDLPG